MKRSSLTRVTLAEARLLKGETDWDRVATAEDDGEIDFDWSTAEVVELPAKSAVSIRLDPEVLDFFKAGGKGYQTRINAVLRSYVRAQRGR
ncbi:MAG: BrnA antitoxin family protein [Paracoccaceae bacterium]